MADDFEKLVEDHGTMVYNLCCKLSGLESAEELTQEVFLKIFQSLGTFRGESKISTWIYRITANTCMEHLRKSKFRKFISFDLFSNPEEIESFPAKTRTPEEELQMNELQSIYESSMDMLPPKQKTAYYLFTLENLSHKEIAEIMQCSVASVESSVFRARQSLRKTIAKHYPEYGGR
ncbi:MAG: RNA polymerase sigma factor [Spirochaetia bacterium]|nr:RNA polymerase sigma factor [Spirochaetia bacterium]